MAEVSIKSVEVSRTRQEDFGPREGIRIYRVAYDIPGMPWMDGHVHTIPVAALANYRIDTAEVDATSAMEYFLREVMTSLQTTHILGAEQAVELESSPLVQQAQAKSGMRAELQRTVLQLSDIVPVATAEAVRPAVRAAVDPGADAPELRVSSTPVNNAVSRLRGVQQNGVGVLSQSVAAHAVDTSVRAWSTLTQMIADDTPELERERVRWFGIRYGERIRQQAGLRFKGGRK